MKPKKISLKYKKERAVWSDVLPYELPLIFSNHHFYDFLVDNDIEFRGNGIHWKKDDAALDALIRLIFGVNASVPIKARNEYIHGKKVEVNRFEGKDLGHDFFESIPFRFMIQHKEEEFRELSICHPRNQIQLVDFYHRYKELILYFCRRSPFSIRRPTRVSSFVFYKDKTHQRMLTGEPVEVEESDWESENLKSFFVYQTNRIHKFHESDDFHRCEKKYNKLLKLDISKCFDSIYTHSLAWALIGKDSVKEEVEASKKTFAGRFDTFMQGTNYKETNGIIIGPEFSRIFAELILQSVDRHLFLELRTKGYTHRVDYESFRYIDDYFIFYNDEIAKRAITNLLQVRLKDFKLHLNVVKKEEWDKPIITNISIAKQRIQELLSKSIAYDIENTYQVDPAGKLQEDAPIMKKGSIKVDSRSLITKFKTIIKESGVHYRDTLLYALSIVERRSVQVIKRYDSLAQERRSEEELGLAILAIIDFSFFIYSVSPRATTTVYLCRILRVFISFLKNKALNRDIKHAAFKLIFDNIYFILDKYKHREHTPVETLYLLIPLAKLGRDYWLDVTVLSSHLNIRGRGKTASPKGPPLNYICLIVLLFYMKNKRRYDYLRDFVEGKIVQKFQERKATLRKDTELILLLLDSLTCPYIKDQTKKGLLKLYGVGDPALQTAIITKRRYWFTKWTNWVFR